MVKLLALNVNILIAKIEAVETPLILKERKMVDLMSTVYPCRNAKDTLAVTFEELLRHSINQM